MDNELLTIWQHLNFLSFYFDGQINLWMKEDLPVQVDGEPWMQPNSLLIIRPNPFSQVGYNTIIILTIFFFGLLSEIPLPLPGRRHQRSVQVCVV